MGKATGERASLWLRARLQNQLFQLGCFLHRHAGKVLFVAILVLATFCVGLKSAQVHTRVDQLWVEVLILCCTISTDTTVSVNHAVATITNAAITVLLVMSLFLQPQQSEAARNVVNGGWRPLVHVSRYRHRIPMPIVTPTNTNGGYQRLFL
ncbi:hypothetical protein ANN_00446 [Periplaneta americana]|uniref:Uncharacterized protein n=1 Tax=Periplaneta americana TaxID=6978 RepID=A0ABQ8TQT2_PERAM|nr:hypothetical protein ANN_00446 [Periplaneta americana]